MRPAVVALAAFAAASCGGERPGAGERAGGDAGALSVRVTTDRPAYAPGEPITLTLAARNPTGAPIALRFATGQRYDFVIEARDGTEAWRWSADRVFTQALGEQVVPADWELNYQETFAGRLAPGSYRVRGILTSLGETLEARTEILVRR